MHYMPADTEATASAVSYSVYHLSQSPAMADNVTEYAFPWRQALDGSWWMQWDGSLTIPVHAERSGDLAAILAGFVAAGQLLQASADAIMALAASREGQTVTLQEITPPEWAALMLTEEDAATLWPAAE
jgi:hypothetical protein